MEKFATSIKEKYQERLINREKQWPPCHSNKLVRLELVEREKGVDYLAKEQKGRGRGVEGGKDRDIKRFPLAYSDLFKVESGKRPVRKVLVEGDAGIGKTTLSVSVSEDWANGLLFQQFELVLLLPLRYKEIAVAVSIPELLMLLHSSKKLCGTIAETLEETEGRRVLIIADGWDELAEPGRLEGSFLYKLVFGDLLPFVSVLLTSRPSASAPLHQLPYIDRFVEVRGFSKEHIVEYIQSEFASDQEKAGRLLEQLESNPLLESVCSVPLNCAINCHLWRTLEEALPTTMTELYKKIILNVVLRNTQKNDKFQHISNLTSFDALPKELQQSWELLCKFAYEAVVRDQVVFSEEELAAIFPHGLENVLCFGLLQIANTILETGYAMSFHFLHLTFQEYLAAQYVVRQISESDVSPKQYMTERIVESDICRFICGIYFNDTKCTCSTDLEPYIPKVSPTLCHCAFEARDESVCFKLFERVVSCTFYAQSAYDCAAVLYVINYRYMFRDNIEIIFGNSGIRETQIRELADILARENGMLQVRELDLSCNDLTDKSISDLFQGASSCFQSLQTLDLRGNRIGYDSITLLGKSTFYQLRHLSLSDCPLGVSGMQALEDAVSGGSLPSLWRLCLAGSLTSDADVNGALLATSLDAILSCNLGLHYLGVQYLAIDLSRNNLGTPGASALATILCQCRTDSVLQGLGVPPGSRSVNIELGETILGDEGLIAFVEGAGCISVHKLSLNDNGIHAIGCSHLADGVCSGSFVLEREIILDNNPIGLQGAAEVGRILSSSYCTLRRVSLRKCLLTTPGSSLTAPSSAMLDSSITSTIRQKVCGHVLQNNVERLDLDCNNFTGDGVLILAGLLQLCPRLKMLGTSQCGITSADLKQLLQHLTNCKDILSSWLGYWDLSNNEIDDDGTVAMVDHLPSLFPNLGCDFAIRSGVKFIGNPISSERMRRTKEEIKRITEENRKRSKMKSVKKEEDNIKFQRDWKEIVDVLCEAANDIRYRPYPQLVVVEEEEIDRPHFSGSINETEAETPIYSNSDDDSEAFCTPTSPTPTHEKFQRDWEEIVHVLYDAANDILYRPHPHLVVAEEEGNEKPCFSGEKEAETPIYSNSDDDSEIFRTPPTSPAPTHEPDSGSVAATAEDDPKQSQIHSPAPELKDLDLIKLINWQGVGLQLGIDDYELQKIELDYQKHDDRKREMFRIWLRSSTNPNYHELIKALEAAKESKAAQQIRENL